MKKTIAALFTAGMIFGALTSGVQAADDFSFDQLSDQTFYYSSGVGGWFVELEVAPDGSFTGIYHDSEMGETGKDYPLGTVYECTYQGQLTLGKQLSGTSYQVTVDSLKTDENQPDEEILDDIRYVKADPAGIAEGDLLILYLPGQPVAELSEDLIPWLHLDETGDEKAEALSDFALYDEKQESGFIASPKPDETGLANPWVETDAEGFRKETGLPVNVPEKAEDVYYSYMPSTNLGQIQFTLNGHYYNVRIQPAGKPEDISGMYYTWTSEESCKIENREGTIFRASAEDGEAILCMWHDMAPGIMYSISSCGEEISSEEMVSIAEDVFVPAQE